MNQLNRPIIYLLILLLLGCASSSPTYIAHTESPGGIGGTGIIHPDRDQNGIGGTGKTLDEGIGGTGRIAKVGSDDEGSGIGGTGIVGTITKFGSIWVNQAHVHFDELTPITINQSPATQGELQLGQVVAVSSTQDGEAYQAKSIDIIHEVVGPISQFSLENRSLEVLNQTIRLGDEVILFDRKTNSTVSLDYLQASTYVEVSGLRQEGGDIVASRLDIVEQLENLQLIGELERNEKGLWEINDQIIEIDELLLLDDISKRALVSGYLDGEVFIADAIGTDSIEMVLEGVAEIIYEGYIFDAEIAGMVNIGGLEFTIQESLEIIEEQYFQDPIQINAILAEDGMYEAHDLMIELEGNDDFIDLIHDEEIEHQELEFIEEGQWEEEVYYDEADLNNSGDYYEEETVGDDEPEFEGRNNEELEYDSDTQYEDESYIDEASYIEDDNYVEEEFYEYEEEIYYDE
jgi:hypothetical protein